MNLRQLINLIEAGYMAVPPAPTSADNDAGDIDTGAAAKPASTPDTPDPKLGIAANSPAITGQAPAADLKNAGDVMRTAQGTTDTRGASAMASAPSAVSEPTDTRGAAAMSSASSAAPTPAVATAPAKKVNFGAVGSGLSPATNTTTTPAATDTRGAAAMASRPATTPTNTTSKVPAIPGVTVAAGTPTAATKTPAPAPAMDQFSQNIAMANRNSGAAAKPAQAAQAAEPAAPADTYSTEKGLFGGDVTVRTDAQGRKFVPNPQKQGAMAYLNRGAPDEVAYRSADDIKQGASNLADRFKSFFGGSKAPDTRGGAAMASRSAPQQVTKEDTDMSELRRLSGLPLNEKAVSKQQQKFMGMVHAMQKGDKVKGASKELKKAAKGMSKKDAKDFASTKHKDLPNKVTESVVLEAGTALEHIINKFKHETKNFLAGSELDNDLYEALFDYYDDNGEMPHSVGKAKNGQDPYQWVSQHLENELDAMGYQRQTESSHALSELARLAGLSEAGPRRKAPAPNYRAIARQRMANMPTDIGTQELGDVGPGEITPLDLSQADKSSTEQFPPSSKFSDMPADEVIAQTKSSAVTSGAAKPTPQAQPKADWMSQDLERMQSELSTDLNAAGKPQDLTSAPKSVGGSAKPVPATPNPDDLFRWPANAGQPNGMTMKEADELNQMRRIAGLKECDMGMDQQDSMNVSTNMSSDGTKSVSISAQGDKADVLLQMLKMAGMRAHDDHEEPEIVLVSGDDEMMEDAGGVQVHDLSGMSGRDLYDETQTNDAIHDGDVLVTDTGVGIMIEAWPVIVSGDIEGFHKLKDGTSWDEFEGGMYAESARKAMEVSSQELDEERVTHYANTPEEEYETVAAITRQGNDLNREKKQFSTDRGRDNPMAFELEESLADMLESIKVKEGEAYDAAWKKTQGERKDWEQRNPDKKYYDTELPYKHDTELQKAQSADAAAKDAKRSPMGRVANTLARGLFGREIDEGGNAGGIDAEQPYKDPKTGKMVTPPRGATMPPPDSEFPPGDKRNMMPPPVKGKK